MELKYDARCEVTAAKRKRQEGTNSSEN